nr:DUF4368 domain-containing protein [uncultured Lachnoanaerobaculum sp.]
MIDVAGEKSSNADSFLRLVKTYTDIKELNVEIIRTIIGEVHIPSNVKTA